MFYKETPSLRDEIAMRIAAAMIVCGRGLNFDNAVEAYAMADLMLKARRVIKDDQSSEGSSSGSGAGPSGC